jgi:hypothetical protein
MVQTPTSLYLHLPPDVRPKLGGKRWAKVDLRAAARRLGLSADSLASQSRQADARSYLDSLRGVASLHAAGVATVGGVSTRHYAGRISNQRMMKVVDPAMRARVQAVLGSGAVRLDAWLDHSGRPRRIEERFALQRTIQLDVVLDFFGYGRPVHISIPPAAEVTDITSTLDK